jgi:hypothetical protein
MKRIAIIYGGPDDEHNFYGEKVKMILENIDREKYEPVQIFMTRDSSFKVFNPKHTNKKLFFSENKIFKFLKDQDIKITMLMLYGEYAKNGELEKKLKENEIHFVNFDNDLDVTKKENISTILN